jgi:molecular chaperone GrpE
MSDSTADGLQALQDKYLRALAELENMRKRTQRDIEAARDQATANTLRVLLPIVDDLERAVAAAANVSPETGISIYNSDGIKAIAAKAKATLASLDVQSFESVGKPFMAELMEAIAKVPTKALPAGQVAVEISRGYQIKGQLLRAAQVAVAEDE